MDITERDLVKRFLDGYQLAATVNGRVIPVLYAPRDDTDPLPWINSQIGPALRFPNNSITVHAVLCVACGEEAGNGVRYRADFPAMNLCEGCAVAELYGDIVQIEKGTLK